MKNIEMIIPSILAIWMIGFICLLPIEKVRAQQPVPEEPQPTQPIPEEPSQPAPEAEPSQPVPEEIQPSIKFREDFSDDELASFVKANEKVTTIQQESEQKMIKIIEDEGLSVGRFNEILESQRNPEKKTEASPEDLTSFNNAAQVIIQENQKIEQQMTTSIEEEGIDIDTYQEILIAYQQSPKVQDKVNKLLSKDDNN